jgi:predicted flavoprotein YhiN
MGFEKAVVADGGLDLKDIDTRTMQSKKINNLYITGDLLDINRPTGGYSLQLCWTTGYIAGKN